MLGENSVEIWKKTKCLILTSCLYMVSVMLEFKSQPKLVFFSTGDAPWGVTSASGLFSHTALQGIPAGQPAASWPCCTAVHMRQRMFQGEPLVFLLLTLCFHSLYVMVFESRGTRSIYLIDPEVVTACFVGLVQTWCPRAYY